MLLVGVILEGSSATPTPKGGPPSSKKKKGRRRKFKGGNAGGDFLSSIRGGTNLKKVADADKSDRSGATGVANQSNASATDPSTVSTPTTTTGGNGTAAQPNKMKVSGNWAAKGRDNLGKGKTGNRGVKKSIPVPEDISDVKTRQRVLRLIQGGNKNKAILSTVRNNPEVTSSSINALRQYLEDSSSASTKTTTPRRARTRKKAVVSSDSSGGSASAASTASATPKPPKGKTAPDKHYKTKTIMKAKYKEMYESDNNVSDNDLIASIVKVVDYTEAEIKDAWSEIKKLLAPAPAPAKKPAPVKALSDDSSDEVDPSSLTFAERLALARKASGSKGKKKLKPAEQAVSVKKTTQANKKKAVATLGAMLQGQKGSSSDATGLMKPAGSSGMTAPPSLTTSAPKVSVVSGGSDVDKLLGLLQKVAHK